MMSWMPLIVLIPFAGFVFLGLFAAAGCFVVWIIRQIGREMNQQYPGIVANR